MARNKSNLLIEREHHHHHHHHLIRFLPLLLLMVYAGVHIVKLAEQPSLSSDDSLPPSNSTMMEVVSEPPLMTHIASSSTGQRLQADEATTPVSCSALIEGRSSTDEEGLLCCDRSQFRTDVCYMKGSIQTQPGSKTIGLYTAGDVRPAETIRPYTRKWETAVMDVIDTVTLRPMSIGNRSRECEVRHKGVPAIVLSTGGYTGNVYHAFNDGLIPLYITAQRFEREVVLVVVDYHSWWFTKYREVLKRLTKYRIVDLAADQRVHCFDEMIVGMNIHGDLTIDQNLMLHGKGIHDFQVLLGDSFRSFPPSMPLALPLTASNGKRPRIAIFIRHKSRVVYNMREIIRKCHRMGFQVQTIDPKSTTPLAEIYAVLNSSDVMVAIHGAAMTHFLFMRPPSALIQIVPLGLDWPAETYYGEPARKMGLEYMPYKIAVEESSLRKVYSQHDPVISDPRSVTKKGWSETKKIYLDQQNVRVNMRRFGEVLEKAYSHACRLHSSE